MINIVIADDHPLVLQGLKNVFKTSKEIRIIGAYSNGDALLEDLKTKAPDVLLLDIQMAGLSGEELARIISRQYPSLKMIALTNLATAYYIKNMFNSGVSGYILKTDPLSTIIKAIKTVYDNKQFLGDELREIVLDATLGGGAGHKQELRLTKRENDVLQLIADNITSKEIAERLSLSKRTIDHHRNNLLLKLDVKNTAAMIKKAISLNLIKHHNPME